MSKECGKGGFELADHHRDSCRAAHLSQASCSGESSMLTDSETPAICLQSSAQHAHMLRSFLCTVHAQVAESDISISDVSDVSTLREQVHGSS